LRKQITRFFAYILTASIVLALAVVPLTHVKAVKFGDVGGLPQGYWPVRSPYNDALDAKNAVGITTHGENVINFWLQGHTPENRAALWMTDLSGHAYELNDLWWVSKRVAEEYEARRDYDNAIRLYRVTLAFADAYIALAPQIGGSASDMEWTRILIQNKISSWDVSIELYAEVPAASGSGDTSYTGAKHEPRSGIYYGETYGDGAVMSFTKKPSAMIIYVRYEDQLIPELVEHDLKINESQHGYNRGDYSVIEIAWNFIGEGTMLRSVLNDRQKITEAAQYLGNLGIPILLRVGAEMNIWEHKANPEEYKAAFRFIAGIMRENAPNVAMVWSVNDNSAEGLTYDMFYPGAEYVDWVGISLYLRKYFLGNHNTSDTDAAIWGTGRYANPIGFIENLVKQYGSRHPIMISETGIQLYNTSNSEDTTDWALIRMRMMYAYIPIMFPQVKAVFLFNTNLPGQYRYDLNYSPRAKELYGQLTSSGYFLGRGQTSPTITYKKIGSATLPANAVTLLTYAPFFTMDNVIVEYRLNGKWLGQDTNIPYRRTFDLSGEADGLHRLEVRVLSGGTQLKSVEYNVSKSGGNVTISSGAITPPKPPSTITVPPSSQPMYIDGKLIEFEAYLINGQNYVKLRDFAYAIKDSTKKFGASFAVDAATGIITAFLTRGQAYEPNGTEMTPGDSQSKPAQQSSDKMVFFLDNKKATIAAYMIGDSNFLRVRDLLELFDICAVYDSGLKIIRLDTTRPFSESEI